MKLTGKWGDLLVLAGLSLGCLTARGELCVWEGRGSGDSNDWFNASNWQDGRLPQEDDNAVVDGANANLLLTNSTPKLSSFTIGADSAANAATLTFTNWFTALRANEVTVNAHGVLTCAGPFTNAPAMSNRVWVVCSNLTVQTNGKIDVDRKGYAGGMYESSAQRSYGQGPGGGYTDYYPCEAGTYGGYGYLLLSRSYYHSSGSRPYGTPEAPEQPGSGGGGTHSREGGAGGGAVRIEAADRVTVDGEVTADGEYAWGASSGSGGAVWITCRRIAGSGGRICANGGASRATQNTTMPGGGGGRVAVWYDPTVQATEALPDVTFEALPGWDLNAADVGKAEGDIGSLWFPRHPFLVGGHGPAAGTAFRHQRLEHPHADARRSLGRFFGGGFHAGGVGRRIAQRVEGGPEPGRAVELQLQRRRS